MLAASTMTGEAIGPIMAAAREQTRPCAVEGAIPPHFEKLAHCLGLPVYVRDVAPHWGMAKIDFTYECSDCGAEIKKTVTKPERH
jgi:hypothetical protein